MGDLQEGIGLYVLKIIAATILTGLFIYFGWAHIPFTTELPKLILSGFLLLSSMAACAILCAWSKCIEFSPGWENGMTLKEKIKSLPLTSGVFDEKRFPARLSMLEGCFTAPTRPILFS